MGSIKYLKSGRQVHWLDRELEYRPPERPSRIRQKQSLPNQLDLFDQADKPAELDSDQAATSD